MDFVSADAETHNGQLLLNLTGLGAPGTPHTLRLRYDATSFGAAPARRLMLVDWFAVARESISCVPCVVIYLKSPPDRSQIVKFADVVPSWCSYSGSKYDGRPDFEHLLHADRHRRGDCRCDSAKQRGPACFSV